MIAVAFLIAVVGVCVLAALFGVDSRIDDLHGRHRPNL
jgi:hypothetical protein